MFRMRCLFVSERFEPVHVQTGIVTSFKSCVTTWDSAFTDQLLICFHIMDTSVCVDIIMMCVRVCWE